MPAGVSPGGRPSPAIETFSLTKRFPVDRGWRALLARPQLAAPALDSVDLTVPSGELFGLLGPNGAGKTTLIKLLTTLLAPTSGGARLNGWDLSQERQVKACIGLAASDERSFYWRLTGRQNLEFFAALYGISPREVQPRVETVLAQAGALEVAGQRFQTCSTGFRQRLSVARALLNQPRLLFLDEPSKGLDPVASSQLHDLIRSLRRETGLTIFLTTHHLQEAEQLCDRVAILDHGRILACGTPAELRLEWGPARPYRIAVRGLTPPLQSRLEQRFPGLQAGHSEGGCASLQVEPSFAGQSLNQVVDALREGGASIHEIIQEPVSLDAIFQRLIQSPPPPTLSRPSPSLIPSIPLPPLTSPLSPAPFRLALAFLRRDWQAEKSYRFSFFMQFFGLLFSTGVFYFIGQAVGTAANPYLAPYGGDYFSFVLIGIAFAGYFGVGLSSFASNLRQAQTTGTLEAMLASPASLSVIILSSALWDYLLTTLRVAFYLLVGALFLGVDLGGGNFSAALLVLLLTIAIFSSLGILAASFIMVLKRGDPVTWFFGAASSLLGGVYYPVAILPGWLQGVSKLLPITYALDALRLALLQGATFSRLLPDILALLAFGLLLLPASLFTFRYAVRRAKQEGSLTHY